MDAGCKQERTKLRFELKGLYILYKSGMFGLFSNFAAVTSLILTLHNMAPQQRHPGRTPHTLAWSSLSRSGNSPLTSIQYSGSRHRHRARAWHSPLSGSTTRDGETPLRLPRSQQLSLYCCSERHLTGSHLLETPDNSDFDVRGLATSSEDACSPNLILLLQNQTDHTTLPLLMRTQ